MLAFTDLIEIKWFSGIPHKHRKDIYEQKLELIAVKVTSSQAKNFIFICWYRPPTPCKDKETFQALRNLLSLLDAVGKGVTVLGNTK